MDYVTSNLYKFILSLGYGKIATIIFLLGIFIDLTPGIKFNPIKAVFRYLGKSFNTSVQNEITNLKEEMNEKFERLEKEQTAQRQTLNKIILDEMNKDLNHYRWEVIDFQNSLVNGVRHSREQYRHVLDSYEKYCNMMEKDETVKTSEDEYYRAVKENGEAIREHYNKYKTDNSVLFF